MEIDLFQLALEMNWETEMGSSTSGLKLSIKKLVWKLDFNLKNKSKTSKAMEKLPGNKEIFCKLQSKNSSWFILFLNLKFIIFLDLKLYCK